MTEYFLKTHNAADLGPDLEGQQVTLTGWVYSRRTHGGLVFIVLRDSTGTVQVTLHKERVTDGFERVAEANTESSIMVSGILKTDSRALGGVEVDARIFKLISPSLKDYPLKPESGKEFLLDNRHLHIRNPVVTTVLRVRAELLKAARGWFDESGFVEVLCPVFITAACEGGATLFPVKYFDRQAYLSQSVQFYQEAAIASLEKVYSIEPSFRAEMSRTRRHLTEFWQIEAEMANAPLESIMEVEEQMLSSVTKSLVSRCGKELKAIRRRLSLIEPPFPRITYDQALEKLRELGIKVEWGEDLGADEERELSKQFETPFFIRDYPRKCKAFYHKPKPGHPEVTLSADLLAPGLGEIAGGGERIDNLELLRESIRQFDLREEEYEWYLDLRRFGSVVHSGFGMGTERVMQWLLRLPHIRDAAMFPRTPARVSP